MNYTMSKDHQKIIDCIREREDIFRVRHRVLASLPVPRPVQKLKSNPSTTRNEDAGAGNKISPRTSSPLKSAMNTSSENDHGISIKIPSLKNLSCQLKPLAHGELLRLYPLGTPGGRSDVDNDFEFGVYSTLSYQFEIYNGIVVLGSTGRSQGFPRAENIQDYDASVDAAIMLMDAEAVLHASGKKLGQFKNSTVIPFSHQSRKKDPEGTSEIGTSCVSARSLFLLAQKMAAPAIAPNFRALEDSFVDELGKAHSHAVAAIDDLEIRARNDVAAINNGHKMKEVLKIENELLEVEARLEAAKSALNKTKNETREYYRRHGLNIQEEYDSKRAKLTADFVEARNKMENEFSSAYFGLKVCKRCFRPFEPHSRGSLPGWKRCSIVGCSSTEDYCLDCSSAPCPRCFAPICSAHECLHEFECKVKPRCGYHHDSDDIIMGIKNGCCGDAVGQRTVCKKCKVERCGKCQVRGLCPACDLLQRGMIQEYPPIKAVVGSGEYSDERERLGFPKTKVEAMEKHKKKKKGAYGSVTCHVSTHHYLKKRDPPARNFQEEMKKIAAAAAAAAAEQGQNKRKRGADDISGCEKPLIRVRQFAAV